MAPTILIFTLNLRTHCAINKLGIARSSNTVFDLFRLNLNVYQYKSTPSLLIAQSVFMVLGLPN